MSKATTKTAPAKRERTPNERLEDFIDTLGWVLPKHSEHANKFKATAEKDGLAYAVKRHAEDVLVEDITNEILKEVRDMMPRLVLRKQSEGEATLTEFSKLLLDTHEMCVSRLLNYRPWERPANNWITVAEQCAQATAFAACGKAAEDAMKYLSNLRAQIDG